MIFNLGGAAFKPPVLNPSYPLDVSVVQSPSASATFEVVIDVPGEPAEYQYQWYVNNSPVTGATNPSYTKTDLNEIGTYIVYCVVTHASGPVTSRSATLTVRSYLPSYSFSGSHELIDDGDENWRVRLKSTGKINFSSFGSGGGRIDVFVVGAGGGGATNGGGGGYTSTSTSPVFLQLNTDYLVTVGGGGASGRLNVQGGTGGASSAFGISAAGGHGGGAATRDRGGNGGSGGGSYNSGDGGSDGSDGESGLSAGGTGQGTTTREFGEDDGELYAGGGGAAGVPFGIGGAGGGGDGANSDEYTTDPGKPGEDNTGGGGGGYAWTILDGGAGGSGIVVIRNHR